MTERLSPQAPDCDRPLVDSVSANGRPGGASNGAAILLVEDDPIVARAIEIAFCLAGHRTQIAAGPREAFSRLAREHHDAILLDMNFGPGKSDGAEGLACLARILADDPAACVVVITAHGGIRIAVAAMQAGARDFAMKPWRNAELVGKLEAAIARTGPAAFPAPTSRPTGAPRLLGESAAMQDLRALIRRVAPSSAGITVTGPSGAGRTLAAMALHAASADAATPLVGIDLRDDAAWPQLDGATNAVLLRYPDQLDTLAQARLLDRLPPGIRCLAVADRVAPLSPALRRRIAIVEVPVPPLAARGDDILLLASHFADDAAHRFGCPPATLTGAAEAAIRGATWPDDVRGLALAIERAVLLAEDGRIDAAALALPTRAAAAAVLEDAKFDLDDAERAVIAAALREYRHNVTRAATALGLSRGALYRRMARYGL